MPAKQNNIIEHLESLRLVLIKSLVALAIGIVPMYFVAPYIIDTLINVMMQGSVTNLNFFSPLEVFMLQIKTALLLDILICFPYIAKQMWKFVLPALYADERKFIKSMVLSSSCLFITGVLFCLFLILPLVISFGMSFATDNIKALLGIGNVLSLAMWLSLIFGIMFQFPLVTYALIRSHIISYENMKKKRVYVFVGILIMSGLLTPPDIISQLMLSIPTYALFEAGIFCAKRSKKQ